MRKAEVPTPEEALKRLKRLEEGTLESPDLFIVLLNKVLKLFKLRVHYSYSHVTQLPQFGWSFKGRKIQEFPIPVGLINFTVLQWVGVRLIRYRTPATTGLSGSRSVGHSPFIY